MISFLLCLLPLVFADEVQLHYSEIGKWTAQPGGFSGEVRTAEPMSEKMPEVYANWVVGLPQPNQKYVFQATWIPVKDGASNAVYNIYDGNRLVKSFTVNQRVPPEGEVADRGAKFQSLGTVHASGISLRVVLSNRANGVVVADALRFKYAQ